MKATDIKVFDPMGVDDVIVLIPVYNDWEAAGLLISRLDLELRSARGRGHIVLIDDGSTTSPEGLLPAKLTAIDRVSVLSLRRNLGHQRALAVGLSYVEAHLPFKVAGRHGWRRRGRSCRRATAAASAG